MNVGSLFTGCGGLDLGLEHAGHTIAWQAELEPACQRVLAERWPDTPNLGDVRSIDWATIEPVDVVAAGFPCQPISVAGKGLGTADERWLWPEVVRAVRVLRPRHVLLENVAALLTRGADLVLADLAALGFVGRYRLLRASDLGAPHRRERWFCVATDPERERVDADRRVRRRDGRSGDPAGRAPLPRGTEMACPTDAEPDRADAAADTERERRDRGRARDQGGQAGDRDGRPEPPRPPEAAADAGGEGQQGRRDETRGQPRPPARDQPPPDADGERAEPRSGRRTPSGDHARTGTTERDRDRQPGETEQGTDTAPADAPGERQARLAAQGVAAAPDAAGRRRDRGPQRGDSDEETRQETIGPQGDAPARDGSRVAWGTFEPAIRRWEHLTRPAPRPTDDRGRLDPGFVEWMLGLPDGWTAVDGVTRTKRLMMLGNAVQVDCGHAIAAAWLDET